jgi:multidrug efflux pump subunit AcrB
VRNAGMTNAKPAILLMIRKLPEANIIETVNSIRAPGRGARPTPTEPSPWKTSSSQTGPSGCC